MDVLKNQKEKNVEDNNTSENTHTGNSQYII